MNKIHEAEFKEKEPNDFGWKKMYWNSNSNKLSLGLPLLILVIGLYWLGKDLGFWPSPVSIWTILFIVFGTYWLIKAVFFR